MSDTTSTNNSTHNSLTKQQRQPFRIKNGDRTHYVYCSKHADEVATFYCAICRKPYGEACVGDERGEQAVCITCASACVDRAQKKKSSLNRLQKVFFTLFGVIASMMIVVNVFVLIKDSPTTQAQEKPVISPQVSTLLTCRHRLETLAKHAAIFQDAFKRAPETIAELSNLVDDPNMMIDPITGAEYIISIDKQQQIKISCPNPRAHGLEALYAVPKKPAKMVYRNTLGDQ